MKYTCSSPIFPYLVNRFFKTVEHIFFTYKEQMYLQIIGESLTFPIRNFTSYFPLSGDSKIVKVSIFQFLRIAVIFISFTECLLEFSKKLKSERAHQSLFVD